MPANFEKVKTIDLKTSAADGMRMVYIPAGEFIMGGDFPNSQPQRKIYLDAYWIDQTPITNAMFALFLNEMHAKEKKELERGIIWFINERIVDVKGQYKVMDGFDDHPVMGVTWYGAQAYCNWAGRNLPTEAQWEKAARGMDGRTYPWGETDPNPELLNYEFGDALGDTKPVGAYPDGASPYGALDMAGGVWEWVSDAFDKEYYSRMPDRNPFNQDSDPEINILRGGSISSGEIYLTTYSRLWMGVQSWSGGGPYSNTFGFGFRCCLPA